VPVRVRTKIKCLKGAKAGKTIETHALLNTGYTGSSAEIIVPTKLAENLNLWPPTAEATESTYDTAGGPARFHVVRGAASLQVVDEDAVSRELTVDLVLSPIEREALLSDFAIGEAEIIILNAYVGYWRFSFDKPDKVRQSVIARLW